MRTVVKHYFKAVPLKGLVRMVRDELGFSTASFAGALGASERSVQNWESGSKRPHPRHLRKMAELVPSLKGEIETEVRRYRWHPERNRTPSSKMKVSREAYEELHAALDLIFERAGSTVIEKVTEMLTRYAGQFAGEKGT